MDNLQLQPGGSSADPPGYNLPTNVINHGEQSSGHTMDPLEDNLPMRCDQPGTQ